MIVPGTWWIVVRFCRYLWVSHLPPPAGAQTSEVDAGRNVSGDATDVYWWYASHDTLRALLLLLLLEGKKHQVGLSQQNSGPYHFKLPMQYIYIYIITSIQYTVSRILVVFALFLGYPNPSSRYVRGSQGGIHWPAMVRTVAMIVAVAVVLVPVVFWVGIHVMRDLAFA